LIKRVRKKLTINQAEAESMNADSLREVKKIPSGNSSFFNSRFNFYYDRKLKLIILKAEDLTKKSKRYTSLSAAQAMVLRAVQKELSRLKKSVTAADLLDKVSLRKCCFETIARIMRILVKKKILISEEIQQRDRVIEVFKIN